MNGWWQPATRGLAWAVLVTVLPACSSTPLVDAGTDAAPSDAGSVSADVFVAPTDAPTEIFDGVVDDAPDDAPDDAAPDAGEMIMASDAATSAETRCDLADDDADGRVDEGACVACPNCGACETLERAGTNYLVCPTATRGARPHEVWAGHCLRLNRGYRLVDVDSLSESLLVEGFAAERPVGVGLRRWGIASTLVDSRGVERDPSSIRVDEADPGVPSTLCLVQHGTGLRSVPCIGGTVVTRVVCEGTVAPGPETYCSFPDTCNGVDDDCDGRLDEMACGEDCLAKRIADHVYTICNGRVDAEVGRDRCMEVFGTQPAMIDSTEEADNIAAMAGEAGSDALLWVGLTNVSVDGGVVPSWVDGRRLGSAEAPWARWSSNEPSLEVDGVGSLHSMYNEVYMLPPTRVYRSPRPVVCEAPVLPGP